eukprot:Pgem_evm1s19163
MKFATSFAAACLVAAAQANTQQCDDSNTCSLWFKNDSCAKHQKVVKSTLVPDQAHCIGDRCVHRCCEDKNKYTCADYDFQINGQDPYKFTAVQTNNGPQKLTVTTTLDANINILTQDDAEDAEVLTSKCLLTTKKGVADSTWISGTPNKEFNGVVRFQFKAGNDNCEYNIPVDGGTKGVKGSKCVVAGDPHIVSLDNKNFNYHAGEYMNIYKSEDFEIKGRNYHLNARRTGASALQRLRIQYKDTVLDFHTQDNKRFLHTLSRKTLNNSQPEHICYKLLLNTKSDRRYAFHFPDGSYFQVTSKNGGRGWGMYLNIEEWKPSNRFRNKVDAGVCGNWDGNQSNDMTKEWVKTFKTKNLNSNGTLKRSHLPDGTTMQTCGATGKVENSMCDVIPGFSLLSEKDLGGVFVSDAGDKFQDNSSCDSLNTSEWGKLAVSSGCKTHNELHTMKNNCLFDKKHGDLAAATESISLLVNECIQEAIESGKPDSHTFYQFAKKNDFNSCNFPAGGSPSSKGCNCKTGFTGSSCD